MNKNRALAAVIAGAFVVCALMACAAESSGFQFGPGATCDRHQAQYCRGGDCDLDIAVTSCSAAGIQVAENELHLCRRDGHKTINWKLPPGGPYKFRDDGIDFKNLSDADDFDSTTRQKGPFRYSWHDKLRNGGGRKFDYTIRLENSSGQHCDKDPRIVND